MHRIAFPSTSALCLLALAASGCASTTAPGNETNPTTGDAGHIGDAATTGHDGQGATSDAGGSKDSSGGSPEAGSAAGGYTVNGPTILDSSGKPHLFRGLARPSLEWSSVGDQLGEADYAAMNGWGANVVRISLNQDFWLQSDGSGTSNPTYDSGYAIIVDQQVQWAEKHSLDVILDLHWSDQGNFTVGASCISGNKNCQQDMADAHSVLFWQQVATKYKGDPHVLFELYNEPRIGSYSPVTANWDTWLNGGTSSGFTVHGMQELYNTVRATGAQNLVVIGGLNWSNDLSGVSTHAVNGTNIIYNTHVYQTSAPNTWDASFGSLSAKYPIIATEFGDRSMNCTPSAATTFMQYASKTSTNGDNPPNELSWTAWAFYTSPTVNACTFPTLLSSWYVPNAAGMAVQGGLKPVCSKCM